MSQMPFLQPLDLPGLCLVTPRRFGDNRGWFSETWNLRALSEAGLNASFVQDNHSYSAEVGTIRGLHYQAPPHAQAKLVRCSRGVIWDVVVDVRRGSPTYGQWAGVTLDSESGVQLFVPEGFLHGFVTRTPDVEIQYKVTDYYNPLSDGAVHWDSLGIDWGVTGLPSISDKDASAISFRDFVSPFTYGGTH
ncbi:MAG: dTDP-4-dehydrorhamnose 3,5-epimerase [Asticcacaulis sp.]